MADIQKILVKMRLSPFNVRFGDVCRVCDHYFGEPRQKGTSHRIFKVPRIYPPLINIQNFKGKVKEYQARQVLGAIDKLEDEK
ncbi:MAG: toxin HicA [Desulfobacteraceae bacterium]|nr:toxin HicA [Desulfobacterales bacterium]MBL6968330.1 toxin HicA [Desulfobacteraceae bacterium]MBL7171287.1 toxin HicA [Desulfobacteraceae bacterium]